jgi:hypothetical protein
MTGYPPVQRPNGKLYRPRAEPRAQLLGYPDDDPDAVVVLGTHDVPAAHVIAQQAVDEYIRDVFGTTAPDYAIDLVQAEQTWIREVPDGDDAGYMRRLYRHDPDRGRAAVRFGFKFRFADAEAANE